MSKRNLYLKTVDEKEAFNKYFELLKEKNILSGDTEIIETKNSLGRITACAVNALCNSPLFNASAMDGVCVESAKTKFASEENPIILNYGEDYKVVDTGDPVKSPYDAVIMAEDVIEIDNEKIKIIAPVSSLNNVRPVGEDIVVNEMILPSKHKITAIDIGAMIASGNLNVKCYKKTTVGVIPTGDEIIEPTANPKEGDIIDSNSFMLSALVLENDAIPKRYNIVKDNYENIKKEILKSVSENDITIINAGSSAGTEDYTSSILKEIGEVIIHGVSIKPGKPLILAIVNNKPVIGLPGYPISAKIDFDIFVKPIILSLNGYFNDENIDEIDAVLTKRLVSSLKYKEFVRVKVGKVNDRYVASPLNRGAASQMSMVRADGLLVIPRNSEGIEAGESCKVQLLKNKKKLENTIVCIGSHDVLLDIMADIISFEYNEFSLSSTHIGSTGGLMALKRNEALIVPTHLLDEKTGEYNVGIIKEIFGNGITLIKGFERIQGIMVKKGNPLNIKSLHDLKKAKFVNRQRGSGTRVLFDYKLKKENIDCESIDGYNKELSTHMSVAASVANTDVDCGIGIYSVANVMNLDFIEIGREEYDFALRTENLNDERVKVFLEIIKSEKLKKKLIEYGGYGFTKTGEIINI